MFLFCVFLSGVCLNYTTNPETKKALLWQPRRSDICLTGRSFVSSGGLCYVWSHLNRDSHHSLVPGTLHPPPEAGQLLPGPENADFHLEPKATCDATRRTAADPRPLQANDPSEKPPLVGLTLHSWRGAVEVTLCRLPRYQTLMEWARLWSPLTVTPGLVVLFSWADT